MGPDLLEEENLTSSRAQLFLSADVGNAVAMTSISELANVWTLRDVGTLSFDLLL